MTKEQEIRKEIKQVVDKMPVEEIKDRIKKDEQEEAIERIEELRDSYELHQRSWANRCLNIIEDYVKNSVYKNKMMEETEYLEEDKTIEKLKKYIENDNFYNTYKEVKEDKRQGKIGGTHIDFCKSIEAVLNMLKEKEAEIEKKDRQIKLMAQTILENTSELKTFWCNGCTQIANCPYKEAVDCIEDFFERKSKE